MELILWRHAEAEDGPPDMGRALTPKGHQQAKKMADWLRSRLPNNASILVSPAKRTQQTAMALTADFTTIEAIAPGAPVESVLAAAGWPDADGTVVIVGHQPTLGEVAARLLSGQNAGWRVKKGAIWWLTSQQHYIGVEAIAHLRVAITPDFL